MNKKEVNDVTSALINLVNLITFFYSSV